jgi:starch-binding outer membrane protein, SusD/RagB family
MDFRDAGDILKTIRFNKMIITANKHIYFDATGKLRVAFLLFLCVGIFATFNSGCKKFVEIDPPFNSLVAGNVYTNDATAAAVLTNMYVNLSRGNNAFIGESVPSITLYAGLGADELTLHAQNYAFLLDYFRNDINLNSTTRYWNDAYSQIFFLNNAIEGLIASSMITPSVKQQLLGEAYFLRGFFYFHLTNMYGDVPLVLKTDWKSNVSLARTSKAMVYEQIVADLKQALEMLSENYLAGDAKAITTEKVRPNKWVTSALLARVYLYIGDWANAEDQATIIINNHSLFALEPLNNVFKKTNKEAIWQLQPVGINANANTGEGKWFILPATGPDNILSPVYLNNRLMNAFEPNDQRAKIGNWINRVVYNGITYYFPYKYKIGNVVATTQEYPVVFRLAEQYLIRSEARTQQNKISEALADLKVIRTRAGLSDTIVNDKATLLDIILHERQVELFTEWGHRWFDLKRTGKIDSVMNNVTPQKANGAQWRSFQALYPVPQADIDKNPNLFQNPAY